jgi:hypothetical protein
MTTIPAGLEALLELGDLPVVALTAAVDHRELRLPVATRTKLPASGGRAVLRPGRTAGDDRGSAAGAPSAGRRRP